MAELRKILYLKRKNINTEDTLSINALAKQNLDKAKPEDNFVLRICIDEMNKINIEFASPISTENIRKATEFGLNVEEGK